ncbi:endolytic transglycosylase MltG [Gracilimonas sp.]|uniref:endolytic transglycosylase MltG n=1 Tax=Gracilimonas sp. TaxID=1974203 RepID=UPI002871992E|nr:endolytic transglycosylase MltG [Gracilimonas sp.]
MNLKYLLDIDKTELLTALLAFILIAGTVLGTRLYNLSSNSAVHFEEQTEILFSELSILAELENILSEHQIEYDAVELEWAANILGWRRYQRGRYVFEGSYSYNSFLSKMTKGIQDPTSVVVLPGSTLERLSSSVAPKFYFDTEDFLAVFEDSTYLAEKGLNTEQLFGRMLPETYLMYWTSSPKDVVNKILREFDRSITEEYLETAEELGYSFDEILTMASIVEWEAKNEDEKTKISGLYWNRLERGMRLQADPTVNFALGERRRLLFEDYQYDHPFNTYLIDGLPPGPITNPSLSTIEATLNPDNHDYLYMVANPDGGHIFTETFREHQIESEKWRIWLREQLRIKRQNELKEQEEANGENS